jgi:hypothetical protein
LRRLYVDCEGRISISSELELLENDYLGGLFSRDVFGSGSLVKQLLGTSARMMSLTQFVLRLWKCEWGF